MSEKEANRLHIIKNLTSKKITLKRATELLKLSLRQVIRIKNSYLKLGIKGLISKKRGKPSPNRIDEKIKQKALFLIKTRNSG